MSRPVHYNCIYCIDFHCFDKETFQQEMQVALGPINPVGTALAFSVQSSQCVGFFSYEEVSLIFGQEKKGSGPYGGKF